MTDCDDYKVEIEEILKKDQEGRNITEIWAKIINIKTNDTIKKLIWWKNEDGIVHDESKELPIEFRDMVDNAWLQAVK